MAWLGLEDIGQPAIAAVLGSASVAKACSFPEFVGYLQIPFRRVAATLAAVVIGIEAALAIALIAAMGSPLVLLSAGLFVVVASAFLAWRLVLADGTTCHCWGSARGPRSLDFDTYPSTWDVIASLLAPAWFGLRNGVLLLGIGELLGGSWSSVPPFGAREAFVVFAACPAIVLLGTIVSIVRHRQILALENQPANRALAVRLEPLVALSWYQGASGKLTPVGMVPWQRQAVLERTTRPPADVPA